MPMDAWCDGETIRIEFDLPGVTPETLDIDVKRNVLTIRAEQPTRTGDQPLTSARCQGAKRCREGPAANRSRGTRAHTTARTFGGEERTKCPARHHLVDRLSEKRETNSHPHLWQVR